jgi:hypothetical protein
VLSKMNLAIKRLLRMNWHQKPLTSLDNTSRWSS